MGDCKREPGSGQDLRNPHRNNADATIPEQIADKLTEPGGNKLETAEKPVAWEPFDSKLENALSQVREWLSSVYSPAQVDRAIQVIPQERRLRFKIWTAVNEYAVIVHIKDERPLEEAYMGAVASRRTPRVGETWTRGNDLPDGRFGEELWRKILAAIVRYEAQEVKSDSWKKGSSL